MNARITRPKDRATFRSSQKRKFSYFIASANGSRRGRIFEPSSGGIGTRLNKAKKILRIMRLTASTEKVAGKLRTPERWKREAKIKAIAMLAAVPIYL